MIPAEIQSIAMAALQGLITSTVFILVLFVGFIVAGFTKFRRTGRDSLVARDLSEQMGGVLQYLPPDAPRGPVNQLRTPELLEQVGRKE